MIYLHSNNTIHRNLTPENVVLDSNFYPKIIDFILAKQISPSEKCSEPLGSPFYLVPEVFEVSEDNQYDGEKVYAY